jgi:hypothetical protein
MRPFLLNAFDFALTLVGFLVAICAIYLFFKYLFVRLLFVWLALACIVALYGIVRKLSSASAKAG